MKRKHTMHNAGVGAALALALLCTALSSPQAAETISTKTGTRFDADKDMQAVLDALAAMKGKPIETLTATEARKQPSPADAVNAVLKRSGKDSSPTALVPGVSSVDTTIAGPAGPLPVRIYTPDGAGPFAVVVYYHGGGWVLADKQAYDGGARGIAKAANAVVVSVDYRRAPEAKFPAQHDDALATYLWAASNAAGIKGDPNRMALAGESAGGNLAIATAIAAKGQRVSQPVHVLAVYPITQATQMNTPSYQDSATAKPLNKAMMAWFADQTFSTASDKNDPRIDLLNANLQGLPPVTLISAQIDPLRSDADLLVTALEKAGVPVEHKTYEGVTHEFFGMAAVVGDAKDAQLLAGQRLKASFQKMAAK